jgi:ABC-type multidrug transport system fused ATPase/permease subunit
MTLLDRAAPPTSLDRPAPPAARDVSLSRVRAPGAWWALAAAAVAAVGQTGGTVVAGRLAEQPTAALVVLLGLAAVGAALLDTAGRAAWWAVVDRAEGRLRGDLLEAALRQPLSVLSEQAVGEVLDRVDDDTHELGDLLRRIGWDLVRTLLRAGPMWVVAGLTWWPAWVLFPLVGAGTVLVIRPLTAEMARRKVAEEIAWTAHAAAMEEGVAARDDVRSSLGQAFLVRRCAELSAEIHARVAATTDIASRMARRAGLLLHALLAVTAVGGVLLVVGGRLTTGELVTLFLVTTMFVGNLDQISRHLPDLQAGLGALSRIRGLLAAEPEPTGGLPVPEGLLDVSIEGLHFTYEEGSFALQDVDLHLPAGQTLALVGRTGSGKSTLAALVSRAVEPPRGAVRLGGVDVRDLDLQALRRVVGVVTQRTDVLAATLLDNLTLFADVPRTVVEAAVAELGLDDWVAGLPDGLDTLLGPGGTTLSAGESQLVAFARLLVRDVQLVVLDEATARMDPVTEARVVRASDRLLAGRTGIVIAHRLATTRRADRVAVLERGRVVQAGTRARLAEEPGPFRDLLAAAGSEPESPSTGTGSLAVGTARRAGAAPDRPEVGTGPGLKSTPSACCGCTRGGGSPVLRCSWSCRSSAPSARSPATPGATSWSSSSAARSRWCRRSC